MAHWCWCVTSLSLAWRDQECMCISSLLGWVDSCSHHTIVCQVAPFKTPGQGNCIVRLECLAAELTTTLTSWNRLQYVDFYASFTKEMNVIAFCQLPKSLMPFNGSVTNTFLIARTLYISERDRRRAWQPLTIRSPECLQSAIVVSECQLQQSVQWTGNASFKG